ncbi:MAG: amidohydrolase family protein, partial [Janthinobacterium lividum]
MTHELKTGGDRGYLRIATEEAFATKEQLAAFGRILDEGYDDPGFISLWGFYARSDSARPRAIREGLLDLGEKRIAAMDATGIDKAILSLTSPGVQVFPRDEAVALVTDANDQLRAACDRYPGRFIGMTSIAPQDPAHAAKEIERGKSLGFRGVMINSHTDGEYLDMPKFDPIFEAAVAADQPIYIHPNTPSRRLIGPMLEAGLDGAVFGFGVETGLHLLRIITSGVFDRWPTLQIIVGHMGEALPFWLFRLDFMHQAGVRSGRYPF